MAAAQLLDRSVTRLKVLAPTASAIGAWGKANELCDTVKLMTGSDPNEVCEGTVIRDRTLQKACRACNEATAKMQRLTAGTPAGEHSIDGLLEFSIEETSSLMEDLSDKRFSAIKLQLVALSKALVSTRQAASFGETAWDVHESLRVAGDSGPFDLAAKKMLLIEKQTKFGKLIAVAASMCLPSSGCEEDCSKSGRCVMEDNFCVAKTDTHCAQSEECKERGRCKAHSGFCRKGAASLAECTEWDGCRVDGECGFNDGICTATEDGCSNSTKCEIDGICSLDAPEIVENPLPSLEKRRAIIQKTEPKYLNCRAMTYEDCRRSRRCQEEGRCSVRWGGCAAMSDGDCANSAACDKGYCQYNNRLMCCANMFGQCASISTK